MKKLIIQNKPIKNYTINYKEENFDFQNNNCANFNFLKVKFVIEINYKNIEDGDLEYF
jgi:hypothetical protein